MKMILTDGCGLEQSFRPVISPKSCVMRNPTTVHLLSDREGFVSDIVSEAISRSDSPSEGPRPPLFELGAIYLNKKRIYADQLVIAGDYLRVHGMPKRYARPQGLAQRILWQDDDLLVVDKPPGIPCHATVDNGVENLLTWLSEIVGTRTYITHRLDIPTSGCLAVAKNPEAVSRFNRAMLKSRVDKEYEALVEGHVSVDGLITHWMVDEEWAPRHVQAEPFEKSLECRLNILEKNFEGPYTRLRIKLETGRTHQIRVQMSALGHPVLNDVMYGATRVLEADVIGLRAARLEIDDFKSANRLVFESQSRWTELFPFLAKS
jgi:23S rRNA pseudouridine1911/1915/1917 synthase